MADTLRGKRKKLAHGQESNLARLVAGFDLVTALSKSKEGLLFISIVLC
jgi:hypothetical protein